MKGHRACAAAVAVLGTLIVAPASGAANPPLIVDDDGRDCPAAPYKTIQNAIFAAAAEAGTPTIAVCPGEYVEGGGGVGTNGLIIIDDVNIKGSGADLVTIKPRRTRASGGQIAETAGPSIRNAVGAIVMIDGDDTQYAPLAPAGDQNATNTRRLNRLKSSLLTVNISGVTIDGNGVYADAGVVFRDAQGSISRSRIANVVTTETSYDTPRAGEYKGSSDGFAIASVTAPVPPPPAGLQPDTAPLPAVPRVIGVDHTRIDKYNAAGVLLDGATGDTPPLIASGIVSQGVLGQNQIVGRTLCINFEVNGDCSNPQIATNGPLYGQDGVRVTAGSSLSMIDTLVSQNLVQGTGAPTRGAATNNENLTKGSGVRLIGGASSILQRSNIVDNSYGVFNARLDGTTANTAVPVRAENNWWGLRAPNSPNTGPAVSPTTNPPVPENPVNGTAVADAAGTTSDAVDFFPYRNGPQSDPQTGEFAVYDAPGPVNDSPPTVGIGSDKSSYHLGDEATLTAAVGDDFGVRRVSFYDGPWMVGSADRKPYSVTYTLPEDIACATRTLTAVAEDSSGQTASSSRQIAIAAEDCETTPTPTPTPVPTVAPPTTPSVAFVNPPLTVPTAGADISVTPTTPLGFKQVDVFLGATRLCTLTNAPYTCRVSPTGANVGLQELRAVVTDAAGNTAATAVRVEVPRFKARSLSVSVKSANRSRNRVLKTIAAEIKLPARVSRSQGCASGSITLVTKRNGRVIDNSQVSLKGSCKVTKRITTTRAGRNAFSVSARFGGNRVLEPITANTKRFS